MNTTSKQYLNGGENKRCREPREDSWPPAAPTDGDGSGTQGVWHAGDDKISAKREARDDSRENIRESICCERDDSIEESLR